MNETTKVTELKVGQKILIRNNVNTIQSIHPYGTSNHSLNIATDYYPNGIALDKLDEATTVNDE